MDRKSTNVARRIGSHLALAFALATGGLLGTTALVSSVAAQGKKEANSKGFSKAYEPLVAIINDPAADYNSARALLPGAIAAIENDLDKNVMGNALIALGGKLRDVQLQRQGITMSLESGRTAPDVVGLYHYYIGKWAYDDKDYAEARRQYQLSYDNGYREGEPDVLIADTYFGENNDAAGLSHLAAVIENRRNAGIQVPDGWVLRGLKVAYDANLVDQANSFASKLVINNGTTTNWDNALSVINALNRIDAESQLDLLRLMRLTDTLKERNQFVEYVETAAANGLPSEVLTVLEVGRAKGVFSEDDGYYKDAKALATEKARDDGKSGLPTLDEARAAANWKVAYGTANAFYSMGAFGEAEDMYNVALEKGVTESQLALERMGMSQVQQGKFVEGKASLEQVTGERAPVALMWIAYARAKEAAGG